MKVVKVIILAIVLIFFLLVIVGFFLPAGWEVSESVSVDASPEHVYPLVSELSQWPKWTAWAASDPEMQYAYSGAESGVGQIVAWSGQEGTGRMEITSLEPLRKVDYHFSMDDGGFGAESSILLVPDNEATHVTWSAAGDVGSNLAARYFMKFFQPYMSADYRSGLERLKDVAEMRAAEARSLED